MLWSLRAQLETWRAIARLRRDGLALPWNVQLRRTPGSVIEFGARCGMGPGSVLHVGGTVRLGDDVHFGPFNYVAAGMGEIVVGSRLLCSPFASLIALNHKTDEVGRPMWDVTDDEKTGVVIGDDCWLATNSVVLPGVELGDRCIVGAGAVVTKSFPSGSRLVGAPARRL